MGNWGKGKTVMERPMKVYPRHPFATSSPVVVSQGCGPHHVAKDLRFDGTGWFSVDPNIPDSPNPTKVFAMESGVVVNYRINCPHCPDSNNCPKFANMILVRGSDGYYTEYAHVSGTHMLPGLEITQGKLLGWVDNSGVTTGPHVHIGRSAPGDAATWFQRLVCDWRVQGVD
ncbi:M23 family metallopeptidase [Streptomyces sp. NPDC057433]|uniref:M23 family metallopeptidase n=1 Tax=Streptomyces sp. NPDC057433 TaxID=3346132 RepID=UPI00369D6970